MAHQVALPNTMPKWATRGIPKQLLKSATRELQRQIYYVSHQEAYHKGTQRDAQIGHQHRVQYLFLLQSEQQEIDDAVLLLPSAFACAFALRIIERNAGDTPKPTC